MRRCRAWMYVFWCAHPTAENSADLLLVSSTCCSHDIPMQTFSTSRPRKQQHFLHLSLLMLLANHVSRALVHRCLYVLSANCLFLLMMTTESDFARTLNTTSAGHDRRCKRCWREGHWRLRRFACHCRPRCAKAQTIALLPVPVPVPGPCCRRNPLQSGRSAMLP